ncbi:hypothetical protein ACI65C_006701 [Semiaphis heraclei]
MPYRNKSYKQQNKLNLSLLLRFINLTKSFSYTKGKISKNDKTKLVLMVGHDNNHHENNIVTKFRDICNERAKNNSISLRIIYNKLYA